MSDDRPTRDNFDFADEMMNLAKEAQARAVGGSGSRIDRAELIQVIAPLIRPLAQELESVKKGNAELALMLTALGKIIHAQQSTPTALEGISQQIGRLGSVESANSKLFDALHGELKGYKDGFLFDALQKPFIRDLVSLFDDFTSVHEQLETRLQSLRASLPDRHEEIAFLETQTGNMENQVHHMIEVFLRMEVELSRTPVGAPVDKRTHRIVSFEPAATEAEDAQVARSIKPGFAWRERIIRPEEIVARRWKAPASADAPLIPAPVPPRTPAVPAAV